jgi:hypothetical protein
MEFTVLKNFKDKYTNKYYGMGFTYETEDAERAAELERGGYVAPKDSELAQMVQTNSKTQGNQATNQNEQAMDEAYTVINGKRVSLKQAQQAQEAQENQATQTGIQQAHDNSTEAVKAGAKGKQTRAQQTQQTQQTVKQGNIQSGQQELEQHVQQSGQQAQQQAQQQGQTPNQALEQKAQQFNEVTKLDQHNEATQQGQQARAKAKTKNQMSE